jgi:hypothetical protein
MKAVRLPQSGILLMSNDQAFIDSLSDVLARTGRLPDRDDDHEEAPR